MKRIDLLLPHLMREMAALGKIPLNSPQRSLHHRITLSTPLVEQVARFGTYLLEHALGSVESSLAYLFIESPASISLNP